MGADSVDSPKGFRTTRQRRRFRPNGDISAELLTARRVRPTQKKNPRNEMENTMSTLSAGVLLFLIMDPLGNIPLFLSLLRNVEPKRRQLVLVRELLIALVVLFVFLFGGNISCACCSSSRSR